MERGPTGVHIYGLRNSMNSLLVADSLACFCCCLCAAPQSGPNRRLVPHVLRLHSSVGWSCGYCHYKMVT